MAFTDYRIVGAVVKKHKLRFVAGTVVMPLRALPGTAVPAGCKQPK